MCKMIKRYKMTKRCDINKRGGGTCSPTTRRAASCSPGPAPRGPIPAAGAAAAGRPPSRRPRRTGGARAPPAPSHPSRDPSYCSRVHSARGRRHCAAAPGRQPPESVDSSAPLQSQPRARVRGVDARAAVRVGVRASRHPGRHPGPGFRLGLGAGPGHLGLLPPLLALLLEPRLLAELHLRLGAEREREERRER